MSSNLKGKIVYSNSYNPWYNLALEEYLLNSLSKDEIILYLWQNQNTVVIGNNQNPWKECDIESLKSNDGKLARRLSGGGAVFHDLGNLNFTFLTSKDNFDIQKQLSVIILAVKAFGVTALFSGRNDIEVEGRKFSGNAFFYGESNNYHHGTLLVDVNMNKLSKYLQVSKSKIQSKGIDSVKARVINLKDLNKDITIDNLKHSIVESFSTMYNIEAEEYVVDDNNENLKELYDKYSSWQWIYGETPIFDIEYENRFFFGNLQLCMRVSKGIIQDAKVFTDALDVNFPKIIEKSLTGIAFNKDSMINALYSIRNSVLEETFKAIIAWVEEIIE